MPWYVYNPGATNVSDPNNYGPPLTTAPACPGANEYLCAIQANDNLGHPILAGQIALFIEMANSLNSRTDGINVKLRPTP
jgi:hypothetical protein